MKKEKKGKERRAYLAWEDNDDLTSTSSQERSEEATLCLMAGYESSSSSQVSSLSSKDKNDYYQLLHDFEELHSETNKIVVMNNRLKGLNRWLENRVSQQELETVDLKTNFKHLEMIYSNSVNCYEKQLAIKPCENYITLKSQVKYLLKTCAKFTRGKANLEVVLSSQNCVLGKAGLGYTPINEKKAKKFSSLFSKSEPNVMPFINCNYCMKKGHILKKCHVRKYDVPKGFMKWIPKGSRKA